MTRSLNVLVPVLVALGLLAYYAFNGELDVARVVGIVVFLLIAAVVATITQSLTSKLQRT